MTPKPPSVRMNKYYGDNLGSLGPREPVLGEVTAMANTRSAEKRIRVIAKKRMRNRSIISSVRTAVKKFERSLEGGDQQQVEALFKEAIRRLDKAVSKGVLHRNTAARKKSRLYRRLHMSTSQQSA